MRSLEPIDAATRIVSERFPACRVAFLSRSVLTPRRTPTSDLDIVVVLDGPPAPYRETIREHGWIAEIFVHSRETLRRFYALDGESRTCTLASMCAEGHVLVGADAEAADIRAEAHGVIDAGPRLLTEVERRRQRYALTDLLDDLRGSADVVETTFIAGQLLQLAGQLALLNDGRWNGMGKWLVRHLAEMPSNPAQGLADAFGALVVSGDKAPMVAAVSVILDRAGGPLTEGFTAKRSDEELLS